jgi:hypothetical protein
METSREENVDLDDTVSLSLFVIDLYDSTKNPSRNDMFIMRISARQVGVVFSAIFPSRSLPLVFLLWTVISFSIGLLGFAFQGVF